MARAPKSAQRSDFRVAKAGSTPAGIRRMAAAFKRRDREVVRSSRAINRELNALQSEYQARLSKLIGRGSPVTIEAGITHVTVFNTDDMHGSTDADIHMRLSRIAVRSCQNIIL